MKTDLIYCPQCSAYAHCMKEDDGHRCTECGHVFSRDDSKAALDKKVKSVSAR